MAEEENLSLEESGLTLERGNRRARKEEPKLSDVSLCLAVFMFVCFLAILETSVFYIDILFFLSRMRAQLMPAFQSLNGR